jgi:hypothetical protein
VSKHVIANGKTKFVFGWDQPLQTFFFQVHDLQIADADSNPVIWMGATPDTEIYDIPELLSIAEQHECVIPYKTQIYLFIEKDNGI